MTFTYTSTDLSEIEASIPSRATRAGLANYQGLDIQKEADIRVDGEEVSIDGALKLAGLVGAPFFAVEGSVCSVEQMRAVYTHEYDGELPAAVEKLLRGAEKHDGSVMALTVNWVSQGLVYEWVAQSDWIDPLLARIRTALENAKAEADAEDENSMDEYRVAFQAAVSTLVESPKFRGEQVSKRSLVAPLILAEAGTEEPPPVFMSLRVMPEANRIVKAKAYEYEQDFNSRISELAHELRDYPEWKQVYTKGKRKVAALKFLMEKADG
jgi:cation transport regulator ChaC